MGVRPTCPTICSAFRARKTTVQQYTDPNESLKVSYEEEIFDLNDEYDDDPNSPNFSTFIPKQDGVYSICASVLVTVTNANVNTTIEVVISVNGTAVAADDDFFVGGFPVVHVCTITQLQAGDRVEVLFTASQAVNIQVPPAVTHFEAARFPSPL